VLLLLLLLSVDLAPSGTRLNTGDSFKSKTNVDNKRHTNAHQPSPPTHQLGFQSPLSAIDKIPISVRVLEPCYYFFCVYSNLI